MNRTKLFFSWCLGFCLVSLTGCTTIGSGQDADPKVVVAGRAEERWKALIEGNLEAAYGYLSPASRQTTPLAVYRGRVKPGLWRSVKVETITCDAELCKANILLKYDLRNIKGLEMNLEEFWIKEEGSWWYVQKK
jgi:hypothetical protein